jgi:hypothetical protein
VFLGGFMVERRRSVRLQARRPFGSRAEDARAGGRRCGSNPTYRGALMSGAPEICLADCSENTYYASSGRSEGARMQAKAHLKCAISKHEPLKIAEVVLES